MTRRPDPADAVTPDTAADVTPPTYTTFADIVEALTVAREDRDWGQRRAADVIGVTQQTLSGWESGRVALSVPSLLKWANGLDVDLAPIPPGAVAEAHRTGWDNAWGAIAAIAAGARTDSPDTTEPNGAT